VRERQASEPAVRGRVGAHTRRLPQGPRTRRPRGQHTPLGSSVVRSSRRPGRRPPRQFAGREAEASRPRHRGLPRGAWPRRSARPRALTGARRAGALRHRRPARLRASAKRGPPAIAEATRRRTPQAYGDGDLASVNLQPCPPPTGPGTATSMTSPTRRPRDASSPSVGQRSGQRVSSPDVFELSRAFDSARDDPGVGVIVLTGEGPTRSARGATRSCRGDDGYLGDDEIGRHGIGRPQRPGLQIPDPPAPKACGPRWSRVTHRWRPCSPSGLPTSRSRRKMRDSARQGRSREFRRGLRAGVVVADDRPQTRQEIWFPLPPVRPRPGPRWG